MPNADQIALEAKRQRLAWELAQGADVEELLTATEDHLGRLRREAERDALAAAEAEQQALDRAAAERSEETIRRKARLRATLGSQALAAAEVDRAIDGLCAALGPFLELGKEAYVLSGGQRRVLGQQQAANAISTRLAQLLPGHFQRPEHQLRKGLVESLAPDENV